MEAAAGSALVHGLQGTLAWGAATAEATQQKACEHPAAMHRCVAGQAAAAQGRSSQGLLWAPQPWWGLA